MEDDIERKSKTQIKKEAEALQRLGEELIDLPLQKLERIKLPDDLMSALIDAKSIKSHIAGRRQRQYIGTLMRSIDPEPIRYALLQTDINIPVESRENEKIRVWRDRLLTGDSDGIEEFLSAFPGLERQRLRQLLRNAQKEQAAGKLSKSVKALEKLIMENINNQ